MHKSWIGGSEEIDVTFKYVLITLSDRVRMEGRGWGWEVPVLNTSNLFKIEYRVLYVKLRLKNKKDRCANHRIQS